MYSRLRNFLRYRKALTSVRKAGIWFVDIPRTSSSSIRTELSSTFGPAFGKSDLMDPSHNVPMQAIPSHLTALEMRRQLGKRTWSKILTFSIVRNPWDRMLSLYNYRKAIGEIDPSFSYKDYLQLFVLPPETHGSPYLYHGYYYQAADYLLDEAGNMLVDHIVYYEQRDQGLKYVMDHCACLLGNLHIQSSPNPHWYQKHYHDDTIALISSICKTDIETFGYSF